LCFSYDPQLFHYVTYRDTGWILFLSSHDTYDFRFSHVEFSIASKEQAAHDELFDENTFSW
jgi:hypothetical protein